jgi:hypothetical protein
LANSQQILANRNSVLSLTCQAEGVEYQEACRLWELYVHTRNEFVQPGDGDEDDDDGEDILDNRALFTEDEVKIKDHLTNISIYHEIFKLLAALYVYLSWTIYIMLSRPHISFILTSSVSTTSTLKLSLLIVDKLRRLATLATQVP